MKAVEMLIWWDRRCLVVMSLIQDQEVGVCGEAVKYGPRHRRKQDQEMCHLHMAAAKIRNEHHHQEQFTALIILQLTEFGLLKSH